MSHTSRGCEPPIFQIDLSLPPSSRYAALATQYQQQLRELMPLFSWLLEGVGVPLSLLPVVQRMAKLLLRRVHSYEENLELRGISKAAQVPMYLLVVFNVVLDLLMGCTSGAVRTLEKTQPPHESKMLHFRTLDWDMDSLRKVVVQLEFVRSASKTPQKVLARSITYVGFVGVLTGVRCGLSMSLNFRPQHNAFTHMENIRFLSHNLLVLLGKRQSISSLLRSCLFSDHQGGLGSPLSLDYFAETLPSTASTAAYLVFSDGQSAMAIEKDRISGMVRRSRSFIVMTNHDLDPTPGMRETKSSNSTSIQSIISESVDRRGCMVEKWEIKVREEHAKRVIAAEASSPASLLSSARPRTRSKTKRQLAACTDRSIPIAQNSTERHDVFTDGHEVEERVSLTKSELRRWLAAWPTTNECTHFSAILDPTEGTVVWARQYLEPLKPPNGAQDRGTLATTFNEGAR
ncbi:hypothetical protein EPUS_06745 [Endocarpon pusillum Z07020]|uniref:ceramidase n=1 Tax=Endocarpon pusillum (strain Z07020 / HMAS-L-300199) TaxID=1263415 RepID=U1HL09_ENDPU|nr:uncharacterized protein EPUS_06745 [Endocarpon pusillum Z07020]ERF70960.1 hypothetical protein EPUS_06745 [Endocarpon pusillum Z07020]